MNWPRWECQPARNSTLSSNRFLACSLREEARLPRNARKFFASFRALKSSRKRKRKRRSPKQPRSLRRRSQWAARPNRSTQTPRAKQKGREKRPVRVVTRPRISANPRGTARAVRPVRKGTHENSSWWLLRNCWRPSFQQCHSQLSAQRFRIEVHGSAAVCPPSRSYRFQPIGWGLRNWRIARRSFTPENAGGGHHRSWQSFCRSEFL